MMAATAGSIVGRAIEPGEADAYHFCGHIFTTGSCPHPTGTPRIDSDGFPLHAADGKPIDNLGRLVNKRRLAGRQERQGPAGSRRPADAARAPHEGLRRDRAQEVRLQHPGRRRLVPLLRRHGPQARRLLLATRTRASTATRRSPATASPAARSSASCTSRRRCRVADGVRRRRDHPARRRAFWSARPGTWSPCGFSMIETIGPTGHTGGPLGDLGRLRDLPPRRGRRGDLHLRRSLPGRRRCWRGRLALVHDRRRRRARSRRSPRRAARASRRRSAASSPSTGAA